MAVGYPQDKGAVDARIGGLTQQFRDTLNSITTFKAWLDAVPDSQLQALGYTTTVTALYPNGEIATLRSGAADLAQLAAVARGTATQATALDFFRFAKWFVGVT